MKDKEHVHHKAEHHKVDHKNGEIPHAAEVAAGDSPDGKPSADHHKKGSHSHAQAGADKGGAHAGDDQKATASVTPANEERFLRLLADFENFRKRTARDRDETYLRANEDLMREMVIVLDHLDIALRSAGQAPDSGFVEGVRAVAQQMLGALGKFGLVPLDVEGQVFDPMEHEALTCTPSESVAENVVVKQTRRGYKLGGRVLRPAQVIVSSGPTPAPAPEAPASGEALPEDGAGKAIEEPAKG